ncbi:hypothetical protein DPX16_9440 [Anabarilius grahami]|uniref:Uncharacterized protein n=1 Tax=Anabarilius grahami TaxID=495550 RepID=A0A3N0Y6N9_ANAGA|nr:hypothetical protein DPX16_9440 [Anabarilius grahami]
MATACQHGNDNRSPDDRKRHPSMSRCRVIPALGFAACGDSIHSSEASTHLIDQAAYGMFALIGKVLALIKGPLLLPRPVFGLSSGLYRFTPLFLSNTAARSPAPAVARDKRSQI